VIEALARAKVNLGLEVLRRRADGYHEIATILHEIDLADRIVVEKAPRLELTCDVAQLATEVNLAYQAARLLQQRTGCAQGATIRIEKRIPIAAGLGGGSSDAAATLLALNKCWGLGLASDELATLATELGADVAFFLRGGTQLGVGRGDELSPLPPPSLWLVVVPAEIAIADKTRRLYRSLSAQDLSDGSQVARLAETIRRRQPIAPISLVNAFERPALEQFPEIRTAYSAIWQGGGMPSLCGAGPTSMSVHHDESAARRVAERVRDSGQPAFLAETPR
jgi:4-diphosphocytidyl-2-C-methyl-D-erythritol kinase